jgi:hypothetical protein
LLQSTGAHRAGGEFVDGMGYFFPNQISSKLCPDGFA